MKSAAENLLRAIDRVASENIRSNWPNSTRFLFTLSNNSITGKRLAALQASRQSFAEGQKGKRRRRPSQVLLSAPGREVIDFARAEETEVAFGKVSQLQIANGDSNQTFHLGA